MTRVALYARFSSDKQKESSITDQFRNCETRATREGWTITARYEDRAISGTTTERPGYQQMLAAAKAKQFDILLVDDFSRLSRDSMEAEQTRRRFVHWGVRLIGVSDGIDTADKGHKMLSGLKNMMNEQFISDMKDKIARGMQGQALQGFHCGGRIYGYNLVPELHPTKTDPYGQPDRIGTKLAINPEQAKWVQWIFERYAEGQSPIKIVTELNRLKVPAPGAAYRRHYTRTPTWSAAALHGDLSRGTGLLNNPLYVGRYVWNRSRREKDPDTGRRAHIVRDKSEWIETPAPHLRIIDEDLWERVKTRRAEVSQGVAALRASLHCRARSTGAGPKYLFSGLLVCGQCGGKFVICETTKYACSTWRTRGEAVCSNSLKVSRALVESLLLQSIRDDLLTDESLAAFKAEAVKLLAERRRTRKPDQAKAQARLQEVEAEIANIMAAIKQGILTVTTKAALEQAEAERTRLLPMTQGQQKQAEKISTFLPNMAERFKTLVEGLTTVTQQQIDRARGQLRELVGGQIRLHASSDGAERFLTAEVGADYFGLINLVFGPKINLVAVSRIERETRGL